MGVGIHSYPLTLAGVVISQKRTSGQRRPNPSSFRVGRDSSKETALAEILQHHEVCADVGGLVAKQGHSVRRNG